MAPQKLRHSETEFFKGLPRRAFLEALHLHRPSSQVQVGLQRGRAGCKWGLWSAGGQWCEAPKWVPEHWGPWESRGGNWGPRGEEKRPWFAALLAATSSAFANHCVVGRERRWPWLHCGPWVSQSPLPPGNQTPWNVNYLLEKTVYFIQFWKQKSSSWAGPVTWLTQCTFIYAPRRYTESHTEVFFKKAITCSLL